MNHRELVRRLTRRARFKFLELPENLQDSIVAALDTNEITYLEAQKMAEECGYQIDDNAIWNYHKAVREERYKDSITNPFLSGLEGLGDREKINKLTLLCVVLIERLASVGGLDDDDNGGLGITTRVMREFFGRHWVKGKRKARKLRSYMR